jgi:hypothetical protein
MKIKKTELDVDFIGGQSALTAAEEKALSDFFKNRKISSSKTHIKQRQSSSKRQKVLA